MEQPDGVGKRGEESAARYLRTKGYCILETNFRNEKGRQVGEIDIIARAGESIVFVEVKTRTLPAGSERQTALPPESAISPQKLERMRRIGEFYLRRNGWMDRPYRFDAVAITIDVGGALMEIRHIEDIFF